MQQKKGKYPDGIEMFTCDVKRNVDIKNKFLRRHFHQKMYLKELSVAVFMVRPISLIKDFQVVNTQ